MVSSSAPSITTPFSNNNNYLALPPKAKKMKEASKEAAPSKLFFPSKLHNMLRLLAVKSPSFTSAAHASIVWLPHGRAFMVTNERIFTREVLPQFFRSTKIKSFQRQLLIWGFHRYVDW